MLKTINKPLSSLERQNFMNVKYRPDNQCSILRFYKNISIQTFMLRTTDLACNYYNKFNMVDKHLRKSYVLGFTSCSDPKFLREFVGLNYINQFWIKHRT